jgi:hypothetical protein
MPHDAADDLAYNPFADHGHGNDRPTTSQGFYGSAFLPSLTNTRRRSPPFQADESSERRTRNGHTQTRPEIQISPPNSAGLHPLKSALFAAFGDSFSDNTQITRPNLSRIISEGQNPLSQEEQIGEPSHDEADVANEEKDVIVHHVYPSLTDWRPSTELPIR